MSDGSSGALSGLRVIESGHLISGPFCAHLFADHGAEVIKVEPPVGGDSMRKWGALYKGEGLYWPVIGRNKKSVTLDLRVSEGQQAFRELVKTADVLVENFRPGTFEKWGIGWEELHAINPQLVMVRISGYGQTGPYKDRAGYGAISEAMSGFRHLTAEPGQRPVRVGISIGDSLAGTQGFIGALLALLSGAFSGGPREGQVIDIGLYEAMWMYMEGILPEYDKLGLVREPTGSIIPKIAPSSVYPTVDGEWVVIGGNGDAVFKRFAGATGHDEWLEEGHEYSTHFGRGEAQARLDGEIAEWTITQTAAAILENLDTAGVPASRIYTAADIVRDPHYKARDMVISVPAPTLGGELLAMPGIVPKLSRTPGLVTQGAPLLGQHNEEVWEVVLGSERFQALRDSSVI